MLDVRDVDPRYASFDVAAELHHGGLGMGVLEEEAGRREHVDCDVEDANAPRQTRVKSPFLE